MNGSLNMLDYADNLKLDSEGIWTSVTHQAVSYPSDGNDVCFQLEADSFWFQHRNRVLLEIINKYPPAGTFFDIGGGNGYVARALQQAGHDVVLVEPGPQGAVNAKRRGLNQVICSTLEDAGFREKVIPAAGFFDVLEHIEDDAGFLNQVQHYLRDQGRIYMTVPSHRWLWSHEDVTAGHFRRHTIASMEKLLKQTGFELEYASYFFKHLVFPIFLLRTLPTTVGLRKSTSVAIATNEHKGPQGLMKCLFDRWEAGELKRIQQGKRNAWYGSSCLVVARKR